MKPFAIFFLIASALMAADPPPPATYNAKDYPPGSVVVLKSGQVLGRSNFMFADESSGQRWIQPTWETEPIQRGDIEFNVGAEVPVFITVAPPKLRKDAADDILIGKCLRVLAQLRWEDSLRITGDRDAVIRTIFPAMSFEAGQFTNPFIWITRPDEFYYIPPVFLRPYERLYFYE